ncbi:MAG: spermidine/putrescine ABC transporter substrate-binding protein [Clostridiales bacterium]|nr:spermidine/putrescine ABC transporter substrate-binding protein [Clostridiales bacterium]
MRKPLQFSLLLCLTALLCACLTGCGSKQTLTVYADGDYISQSVIDAFTEETGIEVTYVTGSRTPEAEEETLFEDTSTQTAESAIQEALSPVSNEEQDPYDDPYSGMTLVEILQSTRDASIAAAEEKAAKRGDTSLGEVEYDPAVYDVILTDGATLGELIENDLLLPLDLAQVTNRKNINAEFTGLDYDPNSRYTVTTMWGTLGLLWNTQLVAEQLTTWDDLWDETYAGQILMPDSLRDTLSVALLSLEKYPNATKESTLNAAFDKLEEQQSLVAEYSNRDAYILMQNDRAALYPCFSGDALSMMSENGNLAFLIPSDGTCRITFGYAVAADSQFAEDAMTFINYMCSATNLAKNAVHSKYSLTSDLAKERLDDYWSTNPVAYPDESILEDTQILTTFSAENRELVSQRWAQLTGQTADSGAEAESEEGDAST